MQTFDLLLAFKIARRIGEGLEAMEKIPKAALEVRLQLGATAPQEVAQFGVEAGERQSLPQAARLGPSRLIRWRFLHQNPSPKLVQPIWLPGSRLISQRLK